MKHLFLESPDWAYSCATKKDGYPTWRDDDAIAFTYDTELGLLFLAPKGKVHSDLYYSDDVTDALKELGYDDKYIDQYHQQMKAARRSGKRFIQGRLWTDKKAISFWTMPTFPQLKDIIVQFDKEGFNISDYKIDLCADGAPQLQKYIDKNVPKDTNFDTMVIHTLPPKEKHDTKQLTAARNTMAMKKAQKLGGMPEAKYNFYRRYGMGDSIHRNGNKLQETYLPEIEADEINLSSFEPQEELNPNFWINGKINSDVRIKLLNIADDFLDTLKVDWVKPEDIVITGSIANYNWSEYSDVDVHILMDYNKVWEKTEFVEDYFKGKKELWAESHPELKIYGFPVEIYVEDINKEARSSGIYSLVKNMWLRKPVDIEDTELNSDYIKNYTAQILTKIDNLFDKIDHESNNEKLEKYSQQLEDIFDRLKNIRKESLSKYGEMGSGNIIWKICRRLGYLEKLWDVVNATYDKVNSLN